MRKAWKFVLFSVIFITAFSLFTWGLIKISPKPPIDKMESAREVLSNAAKDKAATYSVKQYNEAKVHYDSAMANWARENKKFILFRNYDRVSLFAELSVEKARNASLNSRNSYSDLKIKGQKKIDSLNNLITRINTLFTSYPLSSEIRNRISGGKLLLKEAEIDFKNGNYLQAKRKISDSEYLISGSYENSMENLKNYFHSYPQWEKWVDLTIKESKKNQDYSIIVDKVSRKLYVYLKGSKKYEFDAELGKNWVGDKRVKGDHATPEGMYKVTRKIDSGKTKYHKALLLNYPNDEDLRSFKKEVASGNLPASAKIGGLIEIHGHGGRGTDWTEGCIALTDREMDVIYKVVKVGTPVTIVGSMIDFKSVMNR
jgi:hypothetical protein